MAALGEWQLPTNGMRSMWQARYFKDFGLAIVAQSIHV
jgi:hypothetical protein